MHAPRAILFLSLAAACSDYSFHSETRRDVFQQDPRRQVDLLFVVDNSRSMADEQEHLADSFSSLLEPLLSAEVDWRVAATTTETQYAELAGRLEGDADELILEDAEGSLIDEVRYDGVAWAPLVSLQLGADRYDAALNDGAESWCASADGFEGGTGTPGAPNAPCDDGGGPAWELPGAAGDVSVRAPEPGEIVFSEIMALTDGRDGACEWIEISSLSAAPLDLSGLVVRDDGGNRAAFPDGAVLASGQAAALSVHPETEAECGVPVDLVLDGSLSLADGIRHVTAEQPDAEARFRELVSVGTGSYGLEMGLEAALMALEAEQGAFLRDEASLTVVVVSDEDDLSPLPVADYVNAMAALKGDDGLRAPGTFQLAAVVGTEPDDAPDPDCAPGEEPQQARRYMLAAEATGGTARSICGSFDDVAVSLGLTASGLRIRFPLSELPVPGSIDAAIHPSGDETGEAIPLAEGDDFTLELEQRADGSSQLSLVFPLASPPPESAALSVSYALLPSGTDVEALYGETE